MKKALISLGAALAIVGTAAVSEAATSYSNCTALHKHYKYGVARSQKAARYQVNSGHYRPYVSLSLYNANSYSDRDKDGTACEVTN